MRNCIIAYEFHYYHWLVCVWNVCNLTNIPLCDFHPLVSWGPPWFYPFNRILLICTWAGSSGEHSLWLLLCHLIAFVLSFKISNVILWIEPVTYDLSCKCYWTLSILTRIEVSDGEVSVKDSLRFYISPLSFYLFQITGTPGDW